MTYQAKFMLEAIKLAEQGRGNCSPNPFVGAIVVKNNNIVGKGFTQPWGQDHAEIQAIKEAGSACENADLYVTLEPCAHYGKTPPCSKKIIKMNFKNVFAGIKDPNPKVNGKGFQMLQDAGINVEFDLFAEKIYSQLEYYLTYITRKRPFCILKTATTLDGKIACDSGDSKWITSDVSRKIVHELRNEVDVILTGIGTILADNPTLNVRDIDTNFISHPIRAILDSELRIPLDSNIVKTASKIETIVFHNSKNKEKIKKLEEKEIRTVKISSKNNRLDLQKILNFFHKRNEYTILIEAGSAINSSFLAENLVDKLYHFIAPKIVGGSKSFANNLKIEKMKNALKFEPHSLKKIGNDILIISYPKNENNS